MRLEARGTSAARARFAQRIRHRVHGCASFACACMSASGTAICKGMWGILRGQRHFWRAFEVLGISRPVSATRPSARSPHHGLSPEELEQVEELGDEAIIAQQTAAHAPQPRAIVSEESRSVVITEHAARPASESPRNPLPKSSSEATLVIRDRRALDEMRQKILRRQQEKRAHGRRALYLWGALGLAAFVLGAIVAFLATETHGEPEAAQSPNTAARGETQTTRQPSAVGKPGANGAVESPAQARKH